MLGLIIVMKDSAYLVKTAIVTVFFALESYALTNILLAYVRTEDYFTPPLRTLGDISLFLFLIILTYALSIGAWKKWEQYLIIPLPISLGILAALFITNPSYALVAAITAFVLISYDVYIATHTKDLLIKFDAKTILRVSTKGLLFVFALLGAILVFLHSAETSGGFDIGGSIADIAQDQIGLILPTAIDTQAKEIPDDFLNQVGDNGFPLNPEQYGLISGLKGNPEGLLGGLPMLNLDIRDTVKTKVDTAIAPYRKFIPPLIALAIFALIRLLGSLVHFIFTLLVPVIFKFAKSTGWFKTSFINVQKEQLTFSEVNQVTEEPKA